MAGRKGRFSIIHMMMVISIVAAECAFLRASWDTPHFLVALMGLPLINCMLRSLPRLRRGSMSRHFWIGFDMAGLGLIGLIVLMQKYALEILVFPIIWLSERKWISEKNLKQVVIACAYVIAIYSPPQLLIAWFAGRVAARYRIVRRIVADEPMLPTRPSDAAERNAEDRGTGRPPSLVEGPGRAVEG